MTAGALLERCGHGLVHVLSLLRRLIRTKVFDLLTYSLDVVLVKKADLRPFRHVVASREGLYAINRETHLKLAEGQFFGLTVRGSSLFCFQAHDVIGAPSNRGRIVEICIAEGFLRSARVRTKGLDNGCHQIDFIGDDLFVVDTYNQRILKLGRDFQGREAFHPIPPAPRDAWDQGYAHVNSIVSCEGKIYLLKSNGGPKTGQRSEVLRCGPAFEVEETFKLPGLLCHNLVFLEDGTLLSCGSAEGTLISRDGVVAQIGEMMTRGLSVDSEVLVVGDSFFATRHQRRHAPGSVMFYNRSYRLLSRQKLPAAPTEIRRIDGCDLSLSNVPRLPLRCVVGAIEIAAGTPFPWRDAVPAAAPMTPLKEQKHG